MLNREIENRKKLDRYFNEPEMWYLLYNIVRAGNKFEKIGKKIGDVRPENVLINDEGQIKVISIASIPNELNNYQKAVEDKDAKVYLGKSFLNQHLSSLMKTFSPRENIQLSLMPRGLKCLVSASPSFPQEFWKTVLLFMMGAELISIDLTTSLKVLGESIPTIL